RDFADLNQFVDCLLNPGPGCECADVNPDLNTDGNDIQAFVDLILFGIPCPITMAFATSAQITIQMFNPPLPFPITVNLDSFAPDNTVVVLGDEPYNTGAPIEREMISMEMTGFDPQLNTTVQLHESPDLPSHGVVDNVVAGPGGEFLSGDSFFGVFVFLEFPDLPVPGGLTAFNPVPVLVEAIGINQLPPDLPHVMAGPNVPLVFSDPSFQGEIIDVVHFPEPVCVYEVTCIDGPCNECGVSLGDICVGARCPGGTCAGGVTTDCGALNCCVEYTLIACEINSAPPCPFGANACTCDATPGKCCLPDGTCIVTTEADCKEQGGPSAYKGDGEVCVPERCCLPDGSCIQTDPMCCEDVGGTPDGVGPCLPLRKCCLPDDSCVDADPMCCANVLMGTSFPGVCAPVACCFADGSCQDLDPDCCTAAGGTPDGPGSCLPLQKCCLPDDSCIDADPACCVNVLLGTPFAGLCAPIEACCFPNGTCLQLEPDCCMDIGGTPDGVGPCEPIEACCLPNGTCIQAEPLCCANVLGGTADGVRACLPVEACCLADGT
ncbi:MAG: hypothetical protein GY778_32050, partial [bacterium]|nr:hypothetical protein [bacterium]